MKIDPHPYPAYKPSGVSWLGDVPEHWEVRRLKDVGQLKGGAGFPHRYQGELSNELPFFKVGDMAVEANTRVMKTWQHTITGKTAQALGANVFPSHTIVFAKVGAALMLNRRRLLVRHSCIDNNMMGFVSNSVSPPWMLYWMSLIDLGMIVNPGAVPSVNEGQVSQIPAIVPPLDEQAAIVRYLDRVDERIQRAINAKERLIELLTEHRQAVIHRAVTRGLDPNVQFKDSGLEWLGDVPAHWSASKLRHILKGTTIRNRPDLPLLSVVREKGVIIRNMEDREGNHNFIPDDLSNYKVVDVGQLAMNKMKAWQGSFGISEFNGIVSPAYFIFDVIGVQDDFFHRAIRSKAYVPFFTQASDGVRIGQWDMSKERMQEIPFFIPPLDEQTAIVRYLDKATADIDTAIVNAERQIVLLREYRSRLIADVVTGQVDVRGAVEDQATLPVS